MKKSKLQMIKELWNIRLAFSANRNPKWILDNLWFPLILFLLPWSLSDFKRNYAVAYIIQYALLILIAIILYIGLIAIKKRKIFFNTTAQSSTLLYIAFELMMLTWFVIKLNEICLLFISKEINLIDFNTYYGFFLIFFSILAIAMLLISPQLLIWKINLINQKTTSHLTKRFLTLLTSILTGMLVLSAVVVRNTTNLNIIIIIIVMLGFTVSIIITSYISVHLYEFYLLLTNKTPSTRKEDLANIIDNQ